MPGLGAEAQAPSQQDIDDTEKGDSKNRECCFAQFARPDIILLISWAIVFLTIVIVCIVFGPSRVLEACLAFLVPKNPGWEHAVILAVSIAVLMVFPFPVVFIFMLLAGLNYGFWYGFWIILIPQAIGLCFAFILGRSLCRDTVRGCLLGGNYPKAKGLIETLEAQSDVWVPLMLFRFLPVPFVLRNYTPTILNVPFFQLVLTALPHCVWQAILFASLGAMFKDAAKLARDQGKWDWNSLRWQEGLIFAGSIIGGIGCAIYAFRLYYNRQPDNANADGDGSVPRTGNTSVPPRDDDEVEDGTICCCCDRKTCCQPSLRCGVCWGYFGFIGVVTITILILASKYGANEVSMWAINALPNNPDWKTAVVLELIVIFTQILLIPFRAIPLLLVGLFFGIWPGMAYLFIAFFIVLMSCICIGQAMGKAAVQQCIEEEGWSDFRRFINLVQDENHSMKMLGMWPFLFMPDLPRYYFPSVLAVPIWKFAICYVPWCLWVSFVYSSLGAAFQDSVELSKKFDTVSFAQVKWQQVAPVLVAIFITPFFCWYACMEYRKRAAKEDSQPIRPAASTQS